MSWSLRVLASGFMTGLLRTPERNSRSCSATYTALCPASRGHSGLELFPLGPWQAEQTTAFAVPRVASPSVKGSWAGAAGAPAVGCAVGAAAAALAGAPAEPAVVCVAGGVAPVAGAVA